MCNKTVCILLHPASFSILFEIHLYHCVYQSFIPFCCWVVVHCRIIYHSGSVRSLGWDLILSPFWTCVFVLSWINTQEWNCYVVGRCMFSFVRTCQTCAISHSAAMLLHILRFYSLCIYPAWDSLGWTLSVYVFHHIWEIFFEGGMFLKYIFYPFGSVLSFLYSYYAHIRPFEVGLQLGLFAFQISFSLCSADWVIFIYQSLGSLTLYSIIYNLFLKPIWEIFYSDTGFFFHFGVSCWFFFYIYI